MKNILLSLNHFVSKSLYIRILCIKYIHYYEELEQVFDHFPKYHMEILMQKWGERLFSNHFARNLDLLDLLPNILTLSHYQNIY